MLVLVRGSNSKVSCRILCLHINKTSSCTGSQSFNYTVSSAQTTYTIRVVATVCFHAGGDSTGPRQWRAGSVLGGGHDFAHAPIRCLLLGGTCLLPGETGESHDGWYNRSDRRFFTLCVLPQESETVAYPDRDMLPVEKKKFGNVANCGP
jgi:hypothetical protein